jgi:hypothetical protein
MAKLATISHEVKIEVFSCYKCGTAVALDENLYRRLQDDGDTFYCPLGHPQVFSQPRAKKIEELEKKLKETERLRRAAVESEQWWSQRANEIAADLKATSRQLSSTRGQLTRAKKRHAAGICPCCNRQFIQLARHMESKHPEYKAGEAG